jgi:hypothetical protein
MKIRNVNPNFHDKIPTMIIEGLVLGGVAS